MGTYAFQALCLGAAIPLALGVLGCDPGATSQSSSSSSSSWSRVDQEKLEDLRSDLAALSRVQNTLGWYTASQGEPSILSDTYQNTEDVLNADSVALVKRALAQPTLSDEERRALEYLRDHVTIETIRTQTAPIDDKISNAETSYQVQLSWVDDPLPFRELEGVSSSLEDPAKREEIHQVTARFWKEVLNPMAAKKQDAATAWANEMGYGSYIELGESYRRADIVALAGQARSFLEETDDLYQELFQEQVSLILDKPISDMRRSDINFLSTPPEFYRFFPPELQTASFEHFLGGIGLDLKTASGDKIKVDDSPHPLKESRATAFAIRVPEDIRVNLRPVGGLEDYSALFYEGARALHYGWTTSNQWEFQYIGPQATSEGYGEFFNYVWSDPRWLVRYRDYVAAYNTEKGTDFPILSGKELSRLVRHRVFWDLYFLRRYAYARLVYEYILHGGDKEKIKSIYDGPTGDLQEVYRVLFSQAYGFELTPDEALRFRTDVDDFLLSLDYARSFLFAHSLHEAVRSQHGYNWYENPDVGRSLKKLWREGSRLLPEEALSSIGQDNLDFKAVGIRLRRILKEAEALGPGSESPTFDQVIRQ